MRNFLFPLSTAVVLAVAVVLLTVSPAHSQGRKYDNHAPFARTPEEAFKEAKERQCPIVLCVPARSGGVVADPGEFCESSVRKVSEYFVIMFAHPRYRAIESWASQFWGTPEVNIYFFFDCKRKELTRYRKTEGCTPGHLAQTMSVVVKKKGKGISRKKYHELRKTYSKANALLKAEGYGAAHKIFKKISKMKFKPVPPMVETSMVKVVEIQEAVREQFDEIKEKIKDGDKAEILVELYVLREKSKLLKEEKKIFEKMKEVEKSEDITSKDKKKAMVEGKACETYLRAVGFLADGNRKSSRIYFERITSLYKESLFAEKAQEQLDKME